MKATVRIALLAGLALLLALVLRQGAGSIVSLLSAAGPRLLWLVPLHGLPLSLDVLGYWLLIERRVAFAVLFWIAAIREALSRLLPVASVGGDLVGIRLVAARGIPGSTAAASIVIEILLNMTAQLLFVLLGLALLLRLTGGSAAIGTIVLALAVALPLILGSALLLRYGSVFVRIQRLAARLLGADHRIVDFLGDSANMDAAIRALFARPQRLLLTLAWQLASFVAGVTEIWLALRWLGSPVSFSAALALESLTQAARQFLFMVPAGLGVQEAGLIGIGHLLGVGSDVAIALSLTKRMREILFGVPALLSWYWIEGRRRERPPPLGRSEGDGPRPIDSRR